MRWSILFAIAAVWMMSGCKATLFQNGIRMTGMPAWQGIVEENEMWDIVHYIRHLPGKGSLGSPAVYEEEQEEHEHAHGQERSAK